jgi:hypothetical protein
VGLISYNFCGEVYEKSIFCGGGFSCFIGFLWRAARESSVRDECARGSCGKIDAAGY